MTGYYVTIGAVLILGGLAMTAWLRRVWLVTHGWRFADPGAVRLSDAYVGWLRFSRAVGVVMGTALLAYACR